MNRPTSPTLATLAAALLLASLATAQAADFHVALSGKDANPGTPAAPLRTIQRAADLAQPGDVITVHEGVYRERISPPRGGESDAKRIVYQAAPGEKVEIKGSEVVKNWVKVQDDVWKVDPAQFVLRQLQSLQRPDPRRLVQSQGPPASHRRRLSQRRLADRGGQAGRSAETRGQPRRSGSARWTRRTPRSGRSSRASTPTSNWWRSTSAGRCSTRRRRASTTSPCAASPCAHAATPWAPPTAEQIGLIGTHWSKGWIIENNAISHSVCSGIALGKYGDEWDNTSANSAEGYVKTIERALDERLEQGDHRPPHRPQQHHLPLRAGGHRRQPGRRVQHGHRQHHPRHPRPAVVHRRGDGGHQVPRRHRRRRSATTTSTGPAADSGWTGWPRARGSPANLFHDNQSEDLFVEVDHGPFLVDNNIFLSPTALLSRFARRRLRPQPDRRRHERESLRRPPDPLPQGALHRGRRTARQPVRRRPLLQQSVRRARRLEPLRCGAACPCGWTATCSSRAPSPPSRKRLRWSSRTSIRHSNWSRRPTASTSKCRFDKAWAADRTRKLVTTDLLGKAAIPNPPYEQPDGTPIRIDTDYFGKSRNEANPTPGPFENPGQGDIRLKVW